MLSRVAENIYWLARYVERAENTARLINVNSHLLLDLPKKIRLGWQPIIEILGAHDLFYSLYENADERNAIKFLVADLHHPSSILSCLHYARENSRTIRDIIPREAWEHINRLYLQVKSDATSAIAKRSRFDFLQGVILGAQTLTGMLAGTMTHDEGYDFLRMGRNLERGDMTTRIIDVRSASLLPEQPEDLTPYETIQWMSVLKSMTAYQMYRRSVQIRVRRSEVLDFLFNNVRFPRSVSHTMYEVASCLRSLPHHRTPLKLAMEARACIVDAVPSSLSQEDLHKFIDDLQLRLAKLHGSIRDAYFQVKYS